MRDLLDPEFESSFDANGRLEWPAGNPGTPLIDPNAPQNHARCAGQGEGAKCSLGAIADSAVVCK